MKIYLKTSARHHSSLQTGLAEAWKRYFSDGSLSSSAGMMFLPTVFFKWYLLMFCFALLCLLTFEKLLGSLKGKRTEGLLNEM